MKKLNIIFAALIFPVLISGQVIPVKTVIKGVRIYLNGAELMHTAKVRIDKGNSEILFENIASEFDLNSVSVTGKGDFVITSIGQQYDYMQNAVKPSEIKLLEDSLEAVETAISAKRNSKDVLAYEQELILSNRTLSGKQTNVTAAEVQKYADYLRKRITDIKKEVLQIDKDLTKLGKEKERIANQLQELNNKYNQPVNQISVSVSANTPVNAEFEISYLVHNASWAPFYDVRVDDVVKPVKFNYTAKVIQNTGLNWDNIKISLSSRNPYMSQVKPELYPWMIDFLSMQRNTLMPEMAKKARGEGVKVTQDIAYAAEAEAPLAASMADFTTVNENMLAFEFESSIPYTIPSDGKPHLVSLKEYDIPGTFEYYAAPKRDNDGFLVVYLTKWNEYNFLPGEANTFFKNSFIGKTFINPAISKDTMTLSLGRDKGITVERKPVKDFTEDKFLSSDIERFFGYDIIVKNNKKQPVKITVEEQIPISKNEDIKVSLIESSGATLNKETGILKWVVSVDPGKSVTKRLAFSVRHPKDKPVRGL